MRIFSLLCRWDSGYISIWKNDQYVNPVNDKIKYPQNNKMYVRSDKFIYPNVKNAAVWHKKSNAISVISPANAIKPMTNVQNPSTRNIRGIVVPSLKNM
jgi:hypothetical protein